MMAVRRWLWNRLKGFFFKLDAEAVHLAAVRALRVLGLLRGPGFSAIRWVSGASARPEPKLRKRVFGLEFANPVGLAAGFDKDAEILELLPDLGFGFAEIGTVTPRPQPGNERPRLFRDPARDALFNRMGFNGLGAEVVSKRLSGVRERLPGWFRVGVNLGKNKNTSNEEAAGDYRMAVASFEGLADYLVINVSSPNTPGLRSLQTEEALKPIVAAVVDVVGRWKTAPPVLLKLAPEVHGEALEGILSAGAQWGVSGWVLTNTLAGDLHAEGQRLQGGWSGGPLAEISRARLLEARGWTPLPIISVGGIVTADEACRRMELGAELIQIYSGWIFRGPSFIAEITQELLKKQKP